MPRKFPCPAPDHVPECFGDHHRESDPRCRACNAQVACASSTAAFAKVHSLAERVVEFQAALTDAQPESFGTAYARVYRDTFGRPWRRNDRHAALFDRLAALCRKHAIDPATYIAGNMWAMQAWVKAFPHIGFQPTHLSGDKAWRRYHAYVRHLDRSLRHARHDPLAGRTAAAKARLALYVGEMSVAEEFVARFLAGEGSDWSTSVTATEPNETWRSVQPYLAGGSDDEFHRLSNLFGSGLAREREFATLRSAAYLAELYQSGLASRVGFSTFDWSSFARLVERVVHVKPRSTAPALADVEGVSWPR